MIVCVFDDPIPGMRTPRKRPDTYRITLAMTGLVADVNAAHRSPTSAIRAICVVPDQERRIAGQNQTGIEPPHPKVP